MDIIFQWIIDMCGEFSVLNSKVRDKTYYMCASITIRFIFTQDSAYPMHVKGLVLRFISVHQACTVANICSDNITCHR